MEASDAADKLQEAAEKRSNNKLTARAAALIALLAMLLAVNDLGGDNAGTEILSSNIFASDTWAFFQAKNIRQTDYRLAADELETMMVLLPSEAHQATQSKIDRYRATADRYDSEPVPEPKYPRGTGKKELSEQATEHEETRDTAQKQDANFDFAKVLFQIAIVLASVAILAVSWPFLFVSAAVGSLATVLMINGYLLLWELPIG